MAIAANFAFWYFNRCSLETGQIKPICRKNASTMIEEWLGGGSKNDNLSCLHDGFFTVIQKKKKKYNKKYKQIDESIYWFDLVLSELQKETSNQIQATLV